MYRDQKRVVDPLEQELLTVVSCYVGVDGCAIFSAPEMVFRLFICGVCNDVGRTCVVCVCRVHMCGVCRCRLNIRSYYRITLN